MFTNASFSLLASSAALFVTALVACGGDVVGDETMASNLEGEAVCTAYPSCDLDDLEVESASGCLQDDARCYERSMCGATIWCTGPAEVTCRALPVCQPGFTPVETCPQDASCVEETMCGQTITCMDSVQCAGYPSCDGDDVEVEGPSGCLQDDAHCYERSMCGATIWCTGPANP
jgi:hypothetical protein